MKKKQTNPIGSGEGRPPFVKEEVEYDQYKGSQVVAYQCPDAAKLAVVCDIEPGRKQQDSRSGGEYCFQHQENEADRSQRILFGSIPKKIF